MDLIALVDPMMTSAWLYPAVFVLTTLDGFLPMIPSEAVVLTAGVFAASSGVPHLPLVIASAAAGVWVGDHIAYAVGRSVLGSKLVMRSRRLRTAAAAAGRQLDRRGGGLIVTSRFIPGGRYTMNVVSGMTRFPLARFSPAAAVAAVGWAGYTVALGLLGGTAFAANPLLGLALGFGLSLGITAVVELIRRRKARSAQAQPQAEAQAQPQAEAQAQPQAEAQAQPQAEAQAEAQAQAALEREYATT
jgi:membrane protein DedA with SNARE-associated domain